MATVLEAVGIVDAEFGDEFQVMPENSEWCMCTCGCASDKSKAGNSSLLSADNSALMPPR